MKNILFILLLLSVSFASAQKEKKQLDVFLNLAGNYNYRNYTNVIYPPRFSSAFSCLIRSQERRMWEVGFSQLSFQKKETINATSYNLLLGANLAHNWVFLIENNFPIKPILGVGIYTYLSNYDYQPKNSLTYRHLYQAWGGELTVIPGFLCEHNKWLFSLTNSIGIGDLAFVKTKYANPNLSILQQLNRFFNFTPAIGFSGLKLGIARKI